MMGGIARSLSENAEYTVSVEDLTLMVDQALALLDHRFPAVPNDQERTVSPLPSILDRCETLLERVEGPTPIRVVLTFSPSGTGHLETLLTRLPNIHLLTDRMLTSSVRSADLASATANSKDVARTVFNSMEKSLRLAGKYPILLLSHLGSKDDSRKTILEDLTDTTSIERPIAGLIYACHPVRSWLVARHNGWLPVAPMPLEAYAEQYLDFLKDYSGYQIITQDGGVDELSASLRDVAQSLDLPCGQGNMDDLLSLPLSAYIKADARNLPLSHYPDGSIAVDEPLDTPNYLNLCSMLGYDPEVLAPDEGQAAALGHAALPLSRPLPPFRAERNSARLASLLPQLAAITEGTQSGSSVQFVLTTARLIELIDDCLSHSGGFYEHLDQICSGLSPADAALLLIACAGHYVGIGENIHGLALLTEAEGLIPPECRALQILSAELFLRMRQTGPALRLLLSDAFEGPRKLPATQRSLLEESIAPLIATKTNEHGHALLIDHLQRHPPTTISRRRVMIEIGTTREQVPGQGSTEKLAILCSSLGLDFITVDMDPRNSAMARRLFRRLGLPFRAITAKGEDFLANWQGEIDFCFLDAYDFDHGQHSELRQSRYESFLGSRIEDEQCHQMHLDCAISLVSKLSADGAICFDDTWTDTDGNWTAKGTTAMPYLLAHGFKVDCARNRAALLLRG